ncbi:MAG: DUF4388 domain-containing protein [Acidimicrobiales bacterium]
MTELTSSGEAPPASLVGSLQVFALPDILRFLASCSKTGELQLVANGVEGRLWLDGGDLVAATIGSIEDPERAVLELSMLAAGWFYFTEGISAGRLETRLKVAEVLDAMTSTIDEWNELRARVPLDGSISLSALPPGPEVQIRAEQWQVLTAVGAHAGRSVRELVSLLGTDDITTLRLLRELLDAGVVELTGPYSQRGSGAFGPLGDTPWPEMEPEVTQAGTTELIEDPMAETFGGATAPAAAGSAPYSGNGAPDGLASLAEVAVMPPPITEDPWSPPTGEHHPAAPV